MLPLPNQEKQHLLDRLKRMGITAWHEPLLCLPKFFLDYSKVSTLKQALPRNDVVAIKQLFTLIVSEAAVTVSLPKKRLMLSTTDGMFTVRIVIFVVPDVDVSRWKEIRVGDKLHLEGILQNWGGNLQMTSPTRIEPELIGTVLPVYERKRGIIADGAIYDATRYAIDHYLQESIKHLIDSFHGLSEADILRRARLSAPSIEVILRAAHQPRSEDEGLRGQAGMRRLAALSVVENARRLKQRDPDTLRGLQLVEKHDDGFTLSEKGADLRGYGDLFEDAERQSGNSRSTVFRCVDLTPAEIQRISSSIIRQG